MDQEMTEYLFAEDFKVLECECDFRGDLTIGGLLRLVQQVGTDQCAEYGMDDDFYKNKKAVFLLTRQAVQIATLPQRGNVISLQTIAQEPRRAVYKRVTKIINTSGEILALVDSRWVLVNTETRRILRYPPVGFPIAWSPYVSEELEQKIQTQKNALPIGKYTADYSSCDTNKHMNNTRYADLAVAALPLEIIKKNHIRNFRIVYHREIPMGESCTVYRMQENTDEWYICGVRAGHMAFECSIALQPISWP